MNIKSPVALNKSETLSSPPNGYQAPNKMVNSNANKENVVAQILKKPVKQNPLKSYAAFVRDQEKNPNCLKCKQGGESLELLMKHLLRKHYMELVKNNIIEHFPDFYQQEIIQGEVRCNVCNVYLPAMRSTVIEHCGVAHRDVLKHYYDDVKNDMKVEEARAELNEVEELDSNNVLNALFEDLDNENEDENERKEKEAFAKIEEYLGRAKESHKIFVQCGPCYIIDKKLSPCHECKKILSQRAALSLGTCCCFEGFRKLKYSNSNQLVIVGYLNPMRDPKPADVANWSLQNIDINEDLDDKTAAFILKKVGGLLCDMVTEEKKFKDKYIASGRHVIWRRQHTGVREMCDVCSTTIFNHHLTCTTCGIMVCCDCYTARVSGTRYKTGHMSRPYRTRHRLLRSRSDLDDNMWPLCLENDIHNLDKLILTQMSPGNIEVRIID